MKDSFKDVKGNPDDGAPLALPGTPAPYEPPAVLFVERLEAQASVCAPRPPAKATFAPGDCPDGPISS